MTLLDQPGFDTWLARALLSRQRLEQRCLQESLWEARGQGTTLANTLVTRGFLSEGEALEALEALTRAQAASDPADSTRRRLQWRAGAVVGGYELLGKLGSGGMGEVFRARHQTSGAERALKTLLPTLDAELRERFRREGRAQAALPPHPAIAQVHTAGEEAGRLYLVMELVEGVDLAERLEAGPLEPQVAADLVGALALGLEHAHQHGVLHRDLKPANVLLTAGGRPKLVDFGLARMAWEGSLTQSGAIMGTPAYMPPEQIESARAVDARGDVYALGAILYHCLAGRPPFAARTMLEVLRQVMEERPAGLRQARPEIPEVLEAVCLRALEKDPADRFESAADLASALEQEAPPPASRRRRVEWVVAGAVSVAIVAIGVGAWAVTRPAPQGGPDSVRQPPEERTTAAPPEDGSVRATAQAALRDRDLETLAGLRAEDPWVRALQACGQVLAGAAAPRERRPRSHAAMIRVAEGVHRIERFLASVPGDQLLERIVFDDAREWAKRKQLLDPLRKDWHFAARLVGPEGERDLAALGARYAVAAGRLTLAGAWLQLQVRPNDEPLAALREELSALEACAPGSDLSPLQRYLTFVAAGRRGLREQPAAPVPPGTARLPDLVPTALLVDYHARRRTLTAAHLDAGERVLPRLGTWHATYHGRRRFLQEHGRTLWRMAVEEALTGGHLRKSQVVRALALLERAKTFGGPAAEWIGERALCALVLGEVASARKSAFELGGAARRPAHAQLLLVEACLVAGRSESGKAKELLRYWSIETLPPEAVAQQAALAPNVDAARRVFDVVKPAAQVPRLYIPWRSRAHTIGSFSGAWWPGRGR